MEQIPYYIFSSIFYIMIASGFFCGIYSIFLWQKIKLKEVLLIAFLPLASGLTSFTSSFLSEFYTPSLLLSFYTYDFSVYLFFLLGLAFKEKLTIFLKFLLPALVITVIIPLIFPQNGSKLVDYIITLYSFILSILSYVVLKNFLKISDLEGQYNTFYFWLYSSCLFLNFSTLFLNIAELLVDGHHYYRAALAVIGPITYICWTIKYFLILNAVQCLKNK
jgi:hypothetical protein